MDSSPTFGYRYLCTDEDCHTPGQHRSLWFHARTVFLFTKSDFKSIVLPQSVFGVAAILAELDPTPSAAVKVASRIPQMVTWLWLNLLVLNIANQRREESVIEDSVNKPWRPIPSGRITPAEAQAALYLAAPGVLFMSATLLGHRTLLPNLVLLLLVWLYNDVGAAEAGPVWRNLVNAVGVASFGWGAAASLLSGGDGLQEIPIPFAWLTLTAAVTFTTVQSQDLPDMKGDAARNRLTMPLRYGEKVTRWSIAGFALLWSFLCPAYCQISRLSVWCIPLSISVGMAVLVIRHRNEASDKVVWTLWCVWVAVLYLLPLLKG